jgi:hypothetical protein
MASVTQSSRLLFTRDPPRPPWPSTRPPTKQHKRLAHTRAAGADWQPARGRHAPRCAPADASSAGRGRSLAALPRPSQCRPAEGKLNWLKIGTRRAARRRGPAHTLWCCAHGRGADACEARSVRAARGVQRAQQGAARVLSSRVSPRFSSRFGRALSREFSAQKKSMHEPCPSTVKPGKARGHGRGAPAAAERAVSGRSKRA